MDPASVGPLVVAERPALVERLEPVARRDRAAPLDLAERPALAGRLERAAPAVRGGLAAPQAAAAQAALAVAVLV